MGLAGRFSGVNSGSNGRRLPCGNVIENVASQRFGDGIAFGPPGYIHLTEENHAAAFAILHQRAVLEAVAAVDDRQEIATRRLLDKHGGDVATIAATRSEEHTSE